MTLESKVSQLKTLESKVIQLESKDVEMQAKVTELEAKIQQQYSLLTSLLREKNEHKQPLVLTLFQLAPINQ